MKYDLSIEIEVHTEEGEHICRVEILDHCKEMTLDQATELDRAVTDAVWTALGFKRPWEITVPFHKEPSIQELAAELVNEPVPAADSPARRKGL